MLEVQHVFIPERFCKHREFLVKVEGVKGMGIIIPAKDLGEAIKIGRIAEEVVTQGEVRVVAV